MIWRLSVLVIAASIAFAQQRPDPFKAYKNQEDYCRDNPKIPTCINGGKMIDLTTITGPQYRFPEKTAPSPGATRPQTIRPQAAPDFSSIAPVALQDWRFSHSSPALLVSVNIASLLRSPVWNKLLPANARSALSEIG